MTPKLPQHNYAVIMAGGSGTRLWPLSRRNLPKQMQKFVSDKTLIDETVDRLLTFIPASNIYISTTGNLAAKIKEAVPNIPAKNIIIEPFARGTTAAFALVTSTIYRNDKDATIFSLASDHSVTNVEEFQRTVLDSFNYVIDNPEQIALIGIKPTRPDTGLGYIKVLDKVSDEPVIYNVEKFVEKPGLKVAKQYVESGDYYWNAAYYCYKAKTLIAAYKDADPEIIEHVEAFIESGNPDDFSKVPTKAHEIEIINTKKYHLALVPGYFQWSDIGNWQALHEVLATMQGKDLVTSSAKHIDINSSNCLIMSTENKLVATVGLDNVVVVDTPDVLLVLNKEQPQDIKELLESLKAQGLTEYL